MRLHYVKFPENHKILKGLALNFQKPDGTTYDTIVFAGENGVGKTTILKSLSLFFEGKECTFEELSYTENDKQYTARRKGQETFEVSEDGGPFKEVHLKNANGEGMNAIIWGNVGEPDCTPQDRISCISEAVSNFENVTDSNGIVKSEKNIYDNVQSHLIMLERQDNEEYRRLNVMHESNKQQLVGITEFNEKYSRIQKFKNAFNLVFDELQFEGIQTSTNLTEVMFKKKAVNVEIDTLSTGEKQIVFRGTHLLKRGCSSVAAFVDEPEISLHPRWQDKIFNFYQHLFVDETGKQSTQLFIATHSDRVMASALGDKNSIVLCLSVVNGKVVCNHSAEKVLPTATLAETNYVVFGIYSIDYHIQLFAHLQSLLQDKFPNSYVSIKKVDESIKRQSLYNGQCFGKVYQHIDITGKFRTNYETLSCYVRNCIDHPGSKDSNGIVQQYDTEELMKSTNFLRDLLKTIKGRTYDYTGI